MIPGIVTVRTSSSRLPGKCLLPFGECNVIQHIIRRARHYSLDPIVCTSTDPSDDILEQIARQEGCVFYRGSLINKLRRWADCAAHFGLVAFHTVDADDPFFDGQEIRKSFELLQHQNLDMVCPTKSSSAGGASVGYSLATSIVLKAAEGLPEDADTEMMWYYVDRVPNLKKEVLPEIKSRPTARLTLDYAEDYWLLESVRKIVGNFADRDEVDKLFFRNPDLHKINWFRNEEWLTKQLAKSPDNLPS